MAYKTILVHLHDPDRARGLLAAAVPLARAKGAHLIGLTVIPPFVVVPGSESVGATVSIDEHRIAYKSDIARMKAIFDDSTRGQPFVAEWREADAAFANVETVIMKHGRGADVVILAQRDDRWALSPYLEAPERVAMETGRPVLLVPNKGLVSTPPKRALIAWNGRREATRAAFDAVQLLEPGADVTVLWVDTRSDPAPGGDAATADITSALARHGFKCEATRISAPDGDVGAAILAEAASRGTDLIAMGAYGHSRLREFILGGASRDIFARADRLVLLSH